MVGSLCYSSGDYDYIQWVKFPPGSKVLLEGFEYTIQRYKDGCAILNNLFGAMVIVPAEKIK